MNLKMSTNIIKSLGSCSQFCKKNASSILSITSIVGLAGSVICSSKAGAKVHNLLKYNEPTTDVKKEIVKAYFPTVCLTIGTASCIIASNAIDRKQKAELLAAYAMLSSTYNDYRKKCKELYGDDQKIIDVLANERAPKNPETTLFFDEFTGTFFESTMVDVQKAEYHLNRNFVLSGACELNEYFDFIGLPKTEEGEILEWSYDKGINYGYQWIDFDHILKQDTMGREYYVISMPFEPTSEDDCDDAYFAEYEYPKDE